MFTCYCLRGVIWLQASTKEQEPGWGEKYEATYFPCGERTHRCPRVSTNQLLLSLSLAKGNALFRSRN